MSRYIKIILSDGKYNDYQPILDRILRTKLFPTDEITYNNIEKTYEADEGVDLRQYYLPVTKFNNECLIFWRENVNDVSELGNELEELLDNCIDGTNIDYDIELANIADYSDYVNLNKFQTSVLEFPEWTVGLVKRIEE